MTNVRRGYTEAKYLQGYITIGEASEKYNMPISTVRYIITRLGLRTISYRHKTMFEEAVFKRHLKAV